MVSQSKIGNSQFQGTCWVASYSKVRMMVTIDTDLELEIDFG